MIHILGLAWFAASFVLVGYETYERSSGNVWAVVVVCFAWCVGFCCAVYAMTEDLT